MMEMMILFICHGSLGKPLLVDDGRQLRASITIVTTGIGWPVTIALVDIEGELDIKEDEKNSHVVCDY